MDHSQNTLKGMFYSINKPTITLQTLKNPDTIKKGVKINK